MVRTYSYNIYVEFNLNEMKIEKYIASVLHTYFTHCESVYCSFLWTTSKVASCVIQSPSIEQSDIRIQCLRCQLPGLSLGDMSRQHPAYNSALTNSQVMAVIQQPSSYKTTGRHTPLCFDNNCLQRVNLFSKTRSAVFHINAYNFEKAVVYIWYIIWQSCLENLSAGDGGMGKFCYLNRLRGLEMAYTSLCGNVVTSII